MIASTAVRRFSSSASASPEQQRQRQRQHENLLEWNVGGLCLVFLTPMLGGFLYGFDVGATSFVLSMLLRGDDTSGGVVWWSDLSSVKQGLLVSALSLGALLGSHIVLMYLSHWVGRRMELRLCATCYLVGTCFNVLSGTWLKSFTTWGFTVLFVGRLIFGTGVGFVMHGAPAYMAEMCPPEIRGAVVSAKETVIVSGIVLGYATGNWLSTEPSDWTDLYGVSIFLAIPMFFMTFWIPRSKRWLLLHGLREEALESMRFIYRGDQVEPEFQRLVRQLEFARSSSTSMPRTNADEDDSSTTGADAVGPSLWNPEYRPAFIASMGLIVFQQLSGQPSVLSYVTVLFQAAGWSGNASVVTSILMMCTSMTTVALVDRVGRKRLLLTCCGVMITALVVLAVCFWGNDDGDGDEQVDIVFTPNRQITILIAMCVYIGGYQLGFGPITWCIVSEVFPLEIRGQAIALGVELNYLLNFLVQFTFPIMQDILGWGPSFGLFGVLLMVCVWFVRSRVPETKGLTLEEIQVQFSSSRQGQVHIHSDEEAEEEHSNEGSSLL